MRKIKRYQVLKIFENNVFPTKMALKTLNSIKNGIENIDFNTRILEITESIDLKPTQLSVHNTTATTKQIIRSKDIIITKNVDRHRFSSS